MQVKRVWFQHWVLPLLIPGATFISNGMIWCLTAAIFVAAIFTKLKENKKISTRILQVSGLTLVGLGIKVALTTRK